MNDLGRTMKLIGLSSLIFGSTANAVDYTVGQVWSYETRPGEEDSRLIIVAETPIQNSEIAYSIFVEGVKIKNPHTKGGIQNILPHAPISKAALDSSVKELIETRVNLPDYKEGFLEWKKAFDEGRGGVFSVTVSEILTFIETAVNQKSD